MGFFDKLFRNGGHDDGDQPPTMPWDQRPSIYEHVLSHPDPDKGMTDEDAKLPDEDRINKGSQIRWAAGAMDGVMTHHMGASDPDEQVRKTTKLVIAFSRQPTAKNRLAVYQCIIDDGIVPIIDPVIEALVGDDRVDHQRLYELAHSFAVESPDREPVKFGLAILGLYQHAGNEELFLTLGRHDEFTLFCAVALSNTSDDPERSLWTLAQGVDGWGRIHVVERLRDAEDPAVKNWLLREGYRNSVMNEYLAYTAATAGGLLAALSDDHVDRGLLTSAGEILQALIAGGPAESIDDYEDAALAVEMYVGHVEEAAESLADFLHVRAIHLFLMDDNADWNTRAERGWPAERRSSLEERCETILGQPFWTERVAAALESDNDMKFYEADQVARALNVDPWKYHWRRLTENPKDSGYWYHAASLVDKERLPQLLELAESSIDLTKIATGPGDELGMGPGWELHSCLDWLLQELRRFPGCGAEFIKAGLQSPVVRQRNMSINAMAQWTQDNWPDSAFKALKAAAVIEPSDDVRDRMNKVLNGEPLEDL